MDFTVGGTGTAVRHVSVSYELHDNVGYKG